MTLLAASGVKALISGLVAIAPMLATATAATWAWTAALLANPLTGCGCCYCRNCLYRRCRPSDLSKLGWHCFILHRPLGLGQAAFDEGFIQGVAKVLETFNPAVWIAKGINALIETLFGINLAQIP